MENLNIKRPTHTLLACRVCVWMLLFVPSLYEMVRERQAES